MMQAVAVTVMFAATLATLVTLVALFAQKGDDHVVMLTLPMFGMIAVLSAGWLDAHGISWHGPALAALLALFVAIVLGKTLSRGEHQEPDSCP